MAADRGHHLLLHVVPAMKEAPVAPFRLRVRVDLWLLSQRTHREAGA